MSSANERVASVCNCSTDPEFKALGHAPWCTGEYQQGLAEGERRATARIVAYLQRDIGGHAAQLARSNAAYDIKQGEHLKEER